MRAIRWCNFLLFVLLVSCLPHSGCVESSASAGDDTRAQRADAAGPVDVAYRSFSSSAAIGPPADEFFAKHLQEVTTVALGSSGAVRMTPIPGLPAIPAAFAGSVLSAVAAGASGGGFDAAYISGGDLNPLWGFLLNSGVPFGPSFDEFVGFLYGGSAAEGTAPAVDLVQSILDAHGRGVVVLPIVASSEQLSGYFPEPIGDVPGRRGIGIEGLCQRKWVLRYLPPGQDVLQAACGALLASGRIRQVGLSFIAAVPGGGSLSGGLASGAISGLEFATPLDDESQLFVAGGPNPGTTGARYVHAPGWQQQFLITWMVLNRALWDGLGAARQELVRVVARDSLISSYGDSMRRQGAALHAILDANSGDGVRGDNLVLSQWPDADQDLLRASTIEVLDGKLTQPAVAGTDAADYASLLEALRRYVQSTDLYWSVRQVQPATRFRGWETAGGCWQSSCPQKSRRH